MYSQKQGGTPVWGMPPYYIYRSLWLVEEVLQANLEAPAVAVVVDLIIRCGKILTAIIFIHREYRCVLCVNTLILQDASVVAGCTILRNAPLRVEHVAKVDGKFGDGSQ